MSSRRRRYPKRSEVEGPPPNYGVESGDESEQEESSSDEVEEVLTDESEDSNQSDMVRTGKGVQGGHAQPQGGEGKQ